MTGPTIVRSATTASFAAGRPWALARVRRRGRRLLRQVPPAAWVLASAGALGSALAGCAPTGRPIPDVVLAAGFGFVVVLLGAHSSWPWLFWGAVVVAAAGWSAPSLLAGAAMAVGTVVLARRERLEPSAAALIAFAVVQAALRFPTDGGFGAASVLAALAVGPMAWSGLRRLPRILWSAASAAVVVCLAAVGVCVAMGIVVGFRARAAFDSAQKDLARAVDAAHEGDASGAARWFASAERRFEEVAADTSAWWSAPAGVLPVMAQHRSVLHDVAVAGADGAGMGAEVAAGLDSEGLALSDGRVDLEAVAGLAIDLDRLADRAAEVSRSVADAGSPWLLPPAQSRLAEFSTAVTDAGASARRAARGAALAPGLLGADGPRTYLLAFVTPAEARASGGFSGNYGVLVADDGHLDLTHVGRDDELDAVGTPGGRTPVGPADYRGMWGRFEPERTWANLTMSPHFPSVAEAMADSFVQAGGAAVDGVLRIDPVAIAALLEVTGPVDVAGVPVRLDGANAARFLLADQYALFEDQIERSNLLGDVAEVAFDRLVDGSGATPSDLGAALVPALDGGNLALWFRDGDAQRFVADVGVDDAIPRPDGAERFGVFTQNASGNKVDLFLQRSVDGLSVVDPQTGSVQTTVTVTLHNDSPTGGFPDYVIGNLVGLPVGSNRTVLSVFSTSKITGATLDGRPIDLEPGWERSWAVGSRFVDLAPGQTRTLVVTLAGQVDLSDGTYRFEALPQVMVRPDRVRWEVVVAEGSADEVEGEVRATGGVSGLDGGAAVSADAVAGPWGLGVDIGSGG